MMRVSYSVAMLVALTAATGAVAQQPEGQSEQPGYFVLGMRVDSTRKAVSPGEDPLAGYLFPPELIMSHQRELSLQDAQRATITSEIQKAQARFVELQWKMSAETERLQALLEPSTVDEAQVLDQIDRTLAVEREIKRIQVALLVRIKNTLTPSQQATLAVLRDKYATSKGQPNPGWQTHFRLGNVF